MSKKANTVLDRRTPSESVKSIENKMSHYNNSKAGSSYQANINVDFKQYEQVNNFHMENVNTRTQNSRPTTRGSINFSNKINNDKLGSRRDQLSRGSNTSASNLQPEVLNYAKIPAKHAIPENERENSESLIKDETRHHAAFDGSNDKNNEILQMKRISENDGNSAQNTNWNQQSKKETRLNSNRVSNKRILSRKLSEDTNTDLNSVNFSDLNRNLSRKVNFNKLDSIFNIEQTKNEKEKIIAYEHFLRKDVLDRVFSMVPQMSKYNSSINDKSLDLTNRVLVNRKEIDSIPNVRNFNELPPNAMLDYKIQKEMDRNINDGDIKSTKIMKWAKAISDRLDTFISKKDNKTQTLNEDGEYNCDYLYKMNNLAKGARLKTQPQEFLKTEPNPIRQKGTIMDKQYKKFRRDKCNTENSKRIGTELIKKNVDIKNISLGSKAYEQDKSFEDRKIFESDIPALPKINPNNFIQKDTEIRKLVIAIDKYKEEKKIPMYSEMNAVDAGLKKMERRFRSFSNPIKKSFDNNSQMERAVQSNIKSTLHENKFARPRMSKQKLKAMSERLTQVKPLKVQDYLQRSSKKGFPSQIQSGPLMKLGNSSSMVNLSGNQLSPNKTNSNHQILAEINDIVLKQKEMIEIVSMKTIEENDPKNFKILNTEYVEPNLSKDQKNPAYNKYYLPRVYSGNDIFNRNIDNRTYNLQKSYRKNKTYINEYLKNIDASNSLVNKTNIHLNNEQMYNKQDENILTETEKRELSPGDTMVENLIQKLKTKVKSQESKIGDSFHQNKFLSNQNLKPDPSYNPIIDTTKNTSNYDQSQSKILGLNQNASFDTDKIIQANEMGLKKKVAQNFFNVKNEKNAYINFDHTIDFKKKDDIYYSVCTTNDNKKDNLSGVGSILKNKEHQSNNSEVRFVGDNSFENQVKFAEQIDQSMINADSMQKINENSEFYKEDVTLNSSLEKYDNSKLLDINKDDQALITFQKANPRLSPCAEKLHNKKNLTRLTDCCQEINSLKRNFGKIKRKDLSTLKSAANKMKDLSLKNDNKGAGTCQRENMKSMNKDLDKEREVFKDRYDSLFGCNKMKPDGSQIAQKKELGVHRYKTYKYS